MNIVHISAECYPAAKVGGLADVVGSLPKYQKEQGHDVKVIMPFYKTDYIRRSDSTVVFCYNLVMNNVTYFGEILEVHYGAGKHSSKLYEDAQDGYDYTKDRYSYCTFKMSGKKNDLILQQHKRGDFITPYETFRVQLIGLPFVIGEVEIDNVKVSLEDVQYDPVNCAFIVPKDFTELHICGN